MGFHPLVETSTDLLLLHLLDPGPSNSAAPFFAKVSPQDARALARLEREMERVWRQLADDERMRG